MVILKYICLDDVIWHMTIKKSLYRIMPMEQIEIGEVSSQGLAELNNCEKVSPVIDYVVIIINSMALSHLKNLSWISCSELSPNLYRVLPEIWKAFSLE